MKKRYSIIALAMLAVLGANAAERTAQQKKAIALSVLGQKAARSDTVISELKVMDELTVMGGKGVGFAVISNDDRNEAVLAVAEGDFDVANVPDGLQWWLDVANASLESGDAEVKPMLTSKWGQGDPFNRLCPNKSLTGCVATAMAQIMNYHKYPVQGQGSIYDPYNSVMVDLTQQVYDYANMRDVYLNEPYTDAEASAVSTLMYHCGLAVDMSYSQTASGSHGVLAAKALANNFGYNKNIACRVRDGHSDAEWAKMIYEELAAGRPILYSGNDASMGGHAFVFTGYDVDGKVYVNWGWEGEADGYYDFYNQIYSQQYPWKYDYSIDKPSFVEGRDIQITSISREAFEGNKQIKKIILPSSIERIELFAFRDCLNLEEIEFSEGLKVIGDSSFWGTNIKKLVLPSTVEQIDPYAFFNCKNLETVVLSTSLTKMTLGTFNGCDNLKTVTFLSKNQVVASSTTAYQPFSRCPNLESIYVYSDLLNYYQTTEPWNLYQDKYKSLI